MEIKMRKLSFLLIVFLLIPLLSFSQNKKTHIREGNKLYKEKKYNDAEVEYRKSLALEKKNHKAIFNLADALYKQEQYDSAAAKFSAIANQNIDQETTAKSYHNLGNSLLKNKNYKESIDAYKQSLRINPKDMDTKYNLEYARKMLIAQQQQQDNKDDKDNKNNEDNQNQQQQQDNKNNKDNQNQQQQQQQDKISKEDAKRILQALDQDDKKIQKKLKKAKPVKIKPEKQW
ncbi:MAG: tetratricopeptide repeat protein [Ignavibacteria bacterium]|jgi:tetratricopeptide (TPR) repeat protein|nr:tetratricopeptide repeat protein [Ignavibacteria bacterium]